ncbi:hypothetical protein [Streptomyces hainanensis]|nr:hypothetical protein [Streptomyces hainanensis]
MPLAVHRLLPSLIGERRLLNIDDIPFRRIVRWLRTGAEVDRPTEVTAQWSDDPEETKAEFPCSDPGAPVLGPEAVAALGGGLAAAGTLLPVHTGEAKDMYVLLLVEQVVDCLDQRRSSRPRKRNGEIKQAVFHPEAVPADLAAFRIPEFRGAVFWNDWAARRLLELLGDDLEDRLCWSEDRSRRPHPDPWAF